MTEDRIDADKQKAAAARDRAESNRRITQALGLRKNKPSKPFPKHNPNGEIAPVIELFPAKKPEGEDAQ